MCALKLDQKIILLIFMFEVFAASASMNQIRCGQILFGQRGMRDRMAGILLHLAFGSADSVVSYLFPFSNLVQICCTFAMILVEAAEMCLLFLSVHWRPGNK